MIRSLRLRLLIGAVGWIALALVIAGLGIDRIHRHQVENQYRARLLDSAAQLASLLIRDRDGKPHTTGELADPRYRRPYAGLYWQIEGPEGELLRSRSLWDRRLELPAPQDDRLMILEHELTGPRGEPLKAVERRVALPGSDGSYRIVVALERSVIDADLATFERDLAVLLSLLGLCLVIAAAVQVTIGLRPLRGLATALTRLRKGQDGTLSGDVPSEVKPLVEQLNAVLEHDRAQIAEAQAEAANLAHGLKTPLTVLGQIADDLEAEGAAQPAAAVRAQTRRLRRQAERHLARARASGPQPWQGAGAPVVESLEGVLRVLAPMIERRGLILERRIDPALVFAGAGADLEEMAGNVLENAVKWAGHRLRVTAGPLDDRHWRLLVEDDGPGLPPEAREAALTRGERSDDQRSGSGLGLAIVVDLALLYGGRVSLDEASLGGLAAAIELPRFKPT